MRNMTICDECGKACDQEKLINIYPELTNIVEDLKKEYENYDGMVCSNCYDNKLSNGKIKSNEAFI